MPKFRAVGFHEKELSAAVANTSLGHWDTQFTYTFNNFFHPYVGELIAQLNRTSLAGVMDPKWQDSLDLPFFNNLYNPTNSKVVQVNSFDKDIDETEHGAYSIYNWELFYHIPVTIAVHLSKTRRYAEAQRWFHYVFNPTSTDTSVDPTKRFWNFLQFRKDPQPHQIDYLLTLLSEPPLGLSDEDKQLQADILAGYQAMLDKPFMPHAIARTRYVAYQYYVVMKYLDNLIAWGDDLFQAYTVETLNEATMLYVLASNILGPRPEQVPELGTVQAKTFADLKKLSLDKMGDALVDLEAAFPFNLATPGDGVGDGSGSGPLFGMGKTLYFCVPKNQKLLGYWDTVADRLFKIRHCMNIQGIVQPLALFDPPIDPGMLVAAAASGIDISSLVSGLNQPIGPVRCQLLFQKALELCGEVRSLGSALLSAFEKGDAEHLSLLRQKHEIGIQQMMQDMRFVQWKNAEQSTNSLLTSRASIIERMRYYQRSLGLANDANAPDTITISDRPDLTENNFADVFENLVNQYDKTITLQQFPPANLVQNTAPSAQAGADGPGQLYLNKNEDSDLNQLSPDARSDRKDAMHSDTITGVLALIPDMGIDLHFWGLGGHANLFGGSLLSEAGRFYSSLKNTSAADNEGQASNASKTATFQHRGDDFLFQYNLASHELMQNGRQILTSMIAEQVAKHDYNNVKQQVANAQEVDQTLHDKFTNEDLYLWMQGELSRLYYDYYRFAFDTARKAEQTMKQELMRPELDSQTFIQFNYWDAGHQGLLAGEALHLDVKRMEMAYLDNNKRELELVRNVSLRQLDPAQLLALRATGSCTFTVPEWLFDRDCPGHYMRRIKTVALSIPSVVGPYTSVNCTLTLVRSSVRTSPLLQDGEYARQGVEDNRFTDYAGAAQSIVTSTASADSGMFETNLHDERFLPFELAGAVSTWQIDLPSRANGFPAFDYSTISDVILQIRHTARQGIVATKVTSAVKDILQAAIPSGANLALLFSLPNDFPTEWSAFVNGTGAFAATIKREYFPYFTSGRAITITSIQFFGATPAKNHATGDPGQATTDLAANAQFVFSAPEDPAGPTQVLVRKAGTTAYLIVGYTVG
jgi:hypothetical protein